MANDKLIGQHIHGLARECSYTPDPKGMSVPICGRPAVIHGFLDEELENLMACDKHAEVMKPLCFTTHEVGADCGMPGSIGYCRRRSTGEVESWCAMDDDPFIDVLLQQASLPDKSLVTTP